ncbi:hypothetical protein CXF82_09835 [Shewanella sp. GutDb-MelDb]|jgi:hypothetical protein|nr:hypothetical protein CXF82_09835 [Shewanella sp. GutDb-MelDb]
MVDAWRIRPLFGIHAAAAFVNPFTSDEQSSLPGCGMESHDVGQAQPDALKLQYSPMAQTTKPQATKKEP